MLGKKYKINSNLMMSLLFAAQKLKDQEKPEPGYTPKKGEDYFTEEEKREIIDEIIKVITPIKNVDYFDGEDYILTEEDKKEIASKIIVPVVEKVIEKREVIVKEQPIYNTEIKETKIETIKEDLKGEEIVKRINEQDSKIKAEKIEGFGDFKKVISSEIRRQPKQVGGGMGNVQHESKSVNSSTTSITTTHKISLNGYGIVGMYYNSAMIAMGVGYTVGSDKKTVNLLFTPSDGSFIDVIYIRG